MKIAILALSALPLLAQLPAPNSAGVSAGHDILTARNLEASTRFWTTLGAEPAQFGTLKLMKFPGVLFLMRQAENKGGTEGSSVGYLGFKVKDLKGSLQKWAAAGISPLPGATAKQVFLKSPDEVKVRVREDASLAAPIAADLLDMNVPDPAAAQAWYAKWFGAKLVKRDGEEIGEIPGSNVHFTRATGDTAPTRGRAFDRVGLEVKNLEAFCKGLEAGGIKLDTAYRKAANMALAICVLTDPWGTYIELSEGLSAVQ